MPEQMLLTHFSGTVYEWLFIGTFWERMQTVEVREMRYVWWPGEHTHHWVAKLALIVHQVVKLMEGEHTSIVDFYLHLYYDAHVPLMCALEECSLDHVCSVFRKHQPRTETALHEGALPDIISLQLQCSFWNENKPKMQPIVHLMCKALPQRCQIRNLREIISNYCRTDDLVHEFMRSALLCSLLGMYQHNKKRLSWKVRKKIIKRFVYDKPNRMQLQEWLFTTYQHLLFYIIKEFLTYSMRMIPALYDELCNTYKWSIFEKTVWTAMDSVRTTVESNVLKFNSIQDWLSQIESNLMQVNKQQLGNLYRPQRLTFNQNVLAMCERIDEQRHQVNPHVEFPTEYRLLMRHMVKRVPRGHPRIDWLKFFNVSQNSIDSLLNMYKHYRQNTYRSDLRKLLSNSPRYDFEAIRELFFAFEQTHRDIRVFPLPKHYYDKQCEEMRRRYGLTESAEIPPHVGEVYVCLSCTTFKGFVVKKDAKCSNLFANGHHKIIVDDETLKCYCGRRCEKTDTKKRKRIGVGAFLDGVELEEHRKRRIKKEWKTRRKTMQNELCANTECVKFNMTGTLLQFHNKLYMFCPSCANPTTFNESQIDHNGFTCGECLKEGTLYTTVKCFVCDTFRGKDSWTSISVEDEDHNTETIALCNTCYKPWLRQYEQPIPKQIILQQKNKFKK